MVSGGSTMVSASSTKVSGKSTMVSVRSTMVSGRSIMVQERSTMKLRRSTMVSWESLQLHIIKSNICETLFVFQTLYLPNPYHRFFIQSDQRPRSILKGPVIISMCQLLRYQRRYIRCLAWNYFQYLVYLKL